MVPQRIAGLVLVVVGVVLIVVGANSTHSVVDQLSKTFTDRYTDATMWYIVGGIACTLLGLFMGFVGVGKKTA
jgi:uncharacterized membrane protein